MYEISCSIKGLVPMMMDRFFNPEDAEVGKKKSKKTWKEDLKKKLYADKKGVFQPVDNIRMMLIGNQFRPGAAKILGSYIEKSKGTQYINFCESSVWIVGSVDAMKVYIEPKRKTYNDYDERSFINAKGSRSINRRPILTTPWKLNFTIQVTDEQYDASKVKEFFEVAGLRCGCGAYGPTFGRFVIAKWVVKKKKK